MKKKILSLFALFAAFTTFGQTAFTSANEPSIGETRTMYVCDSSAFDYASTTGSGVIWNYGLTNTYAGQTRVLSVVDPSTTPNASDYPGSTIVVEIQDYISSYMSSGPTGRSSQGYLFEDATFGTVKAKFTTNSEELMTYPFAFNNQISDNFSGNLGFVYSSIPQNPACAGVAMSKYDGYGTFVQVNGISLPNISRFHLRDTTTATVLLFGTVSIIRTQFEYYDLASSNKTPIFVHAHVKIEAGGSALIELSTILSAVPGNGIASIDENKKINNAVYPNPAKGELTITNLSSNAVVTLVDLSGKTNQLEMLENNQFNLSNFSTGVYILKIENDGEVQTKRLILQ